MPILGIMASQISGHLVPPYDGPYGAFDSLATVTLSTSTASITFAGIPSGYKHLQIRFMATTVRPTYGIDGLYINLNSDFAANYTLHNINGNGAVANSGGGGGQTAAYMDFVLGTTVANYPGLGIIDILDYADINKNKVLRALGGCDNNGLIAGYPGRINYLSSAWLNTAAITSLTFTPVNNNFSQYSSFALYGVK